MPTPGFHEPGRGGRAARWTEPLIPTARLNPTERENVRRAGEAARALQRGDPTLAVEMGYLTQEQADLDFPEYAIERLPEPLTELPLAAANALSELRKRIDRQR